MEVPCNMLGTYLNLGDNKMKNKKGSAMADRTIVVIILALVLVGAFFMLSGFGQSLISKFRSMPDWKDPTKLATLPQQFRYSLTTEEVEWYSGEDWIKLPNIDERTKKRSMTLRDKKVDEEELVNLFKGFWSSGKREDNSVDISRYEIFKFTSLYVFLKIKGGFAFDEFYYIDNGGKVYSGKPTIIGKFSVEGLSDYFKFKKSIFSSYESEEPNFLRNIKYESLAWMSKDRKKLYLSDVNGKNLKTLDLLREEKFNKPGLFWGEEQLTRFLFYPKDDNLKENVVIEIILKDAKIYPFYSVEECNIYAITANLNVLKEIKDAAFVQHLKDASTGWRDSVFKSPLRIEFTNPDGTKGEGYYCVEKWETKYLIVDLSSSKAVSPDADCGVKIYGE